MGKIAERLGDILESAAEIADYVLDHVPFMTISADKHHRTPEENKSNSDRLYSTLSSYGRVIQLTGYYQEIGELEPGKETSFFVPMPKGMDVDTFKSHASSLCGQYDQECVIFSDGKHIGFLNPSGGFDKKWTDISFRPYDIRQAWSEISGQKFTYIE